MDWERGYTASYTLDIIDKTTWREIDSIDITGGSITRESSGLLQSASIDCTDYEGNEERWVRLYLDTKQAGNSEHVPIFTGLATSPGDSYDGSYQTNTINCYSVLKPAEDVLLDRGWYAPAGVPGGQLISQLLSVTPAPVTVEGNSPEITRSIVADEDETNLSMCEKILQAIGWRIVIDGYGGIHVRALSDEPVAVLDPLENDLIEMTVDVEYDWFSAPNVFRAVYNELTAVARDDSPASPLSTVNRGREIWAQDTSCELANNETIAECAQRLLKEAQNVEKTATYDRRFMPDITPGDVLRFRYPEQSLNGLYRVESQDIELGFSAKTSEKVTCVQED